MRLTKRPIARALATAFSVLGLGLLVWGYLPPRRVTQVLSAGPADASATGRLPGQTPRDLGGTGTSRLDVTLEFPAVVRAGDSGLVQLRIHPDGSLETDRVSVGLPAGMGEKLLDEARGSPSFLIQARLELEDAQVRPQGDVTAAWSPAQGTQFAWTVSDLEVELARGTAWTFLLPESSSNLNGARVAFSAQALEIRRAGLLGLSGPASRLSGAALLLLAVLIGLPSLEHGMYGPGARLESV